MGKSLVNIIFSACALLCVIVLSMSSQVQAQVFFNSTHVPVWNQQVDQPAVMGTSQGLRAFASYRYQWVSLEGSPMTVYAGADMKLPIKNSSGGVFLAHDRVGAASFTSLNISYAYSIPIKKNHLNIGAKIGIVNSVLDESKLTTPSDNIGVVDPLLSGEKQSSIRPDFGVGMTYIHSVFQAGFFINNIANLSTKLQGIDTKFNSDFGRYIGLHAQAKIPINGSFSIDPAIFLRSNVVNYQFDVSLLATYKEKYSLGLGVRGYNKRSFESLFLLSKMRIFKNLDIMYSFDVTLNKIQYVSHGSHEISLQYILPKNYKSNKSKIINNPRYL